MSTIWKRSYSPSTKGHSLIETMVSVALVGLMMISVYSVLMAGIRYLVVTSASVEMQQQSLLAAVWMTRELGESNPRTISVFNSPNGILFGSPRDDAGNTWVDVSGSVRWPKFICYYIDTVNDVPCLLRKEQYLDDPDLHTDPPPLLPPAPQSWQTLDYYKALEIQPRVVARHVESLTFTGPSATSFNPMRIQLGIGTTELGRKFQINLSVKVTMKN